MNEPYSDKTEQELIQLALDIQDACNLSGVLIAFTCAVIQLRKLGITDVNRHRVCRLFNSKINSLVGDIELNDFGKL